MLPNYQAIMQQASAAQERALWELYFVGFLSWAPILVCAVFTVLVFWKLCRIEKALSAILAVDEAARPLRQEPTERGRRAEGRPALGNEPGEDNSRYMPKSPR